jgi:hypothetical protein
MSAVMPLLVLMAQALAALIAACILLAWVAAAPPQENWTDENTWGMR